MTQKNAKTKRNQIVSIIFILNAYKYFTLCFLIQVFSKDQHFKHQFKLRLFSFACGCKVENYEYYPASCATGS